MRVQAPPTSEGLTVAVYGVESTWSEAIEPDSVTLGGSYDRLQYPADYDSAASAFSFDFGPLAQRWLDQGDTLGVMIRLTGEGANTRRLAFYSREASEASDRPVLDLVFTRPPEVRLGRGGMAP
jgi:hypothetical protein